MRAQRLSGQILPVKEGNGAALSSCTSPKVFSGTGGDSPLSQSSGALPPSCRKKIQQGVPAQSHEPCRCCFRDLSLEGSFSPAVLPSCLWNLARRKEPGQPKKPQDGFGTTNVFIYFKGGWCSGDFFCLLKCLWLTALPGLRPQREK